MLIRFTVKNFRSLFDVQEFTFSTSSDRTHAETHCMPTGFKSVPRVSKAAVVFGPNGSGKSNLINAFSVMRDLVLHSSTLSEDQFAARYTPFMLDRTTGLPTAFEVDVVLGEVRYQYAFSYTQRRICSERLLVFPTGKSQRWFERSVSEDVEPESWAPFSSNFTGPRVIWRDATRPQALFLTTAALLNANQLEPLFDWFENRLHMVFASDRADLGPVVEYLQDPERKRLMLEFLRGAGLHVHDVRVTELHPTASRPAGRAIERPAVSGRPSASSEPKTLEFSHLRDDGSEVWMRSAEESAGTLRLIALIAPLLTAVERGQLLLVDEFDLSLHPLVARYLIDLFNDTDLSRHGAQLLLTSHNTNLLDMDVLRRDEIWLMQLDNKCASSLFRMWQSASPPRKHELIGKHYLSGRYGAVPTIRSPEIVLEAVQRPQSTLPRNVPGKRLT